LLRQLRAKEVTDAKATTKLFPLYHHRLPKVNREEVIVHLTNEERETTINFDETPADAVIFTYSKRWQRHIEQKLGIKSHMNNGYGGREYYVPKSRLRLPQPKRVLTPEQREQKVKMGKRLAGQRHQKSLISAGNTITNHTKKVKTSSEGKDTARQKEGQK